MPWPYSRLFLILALIFFILDALLLGGVITGDNLTWLLPAGAAATVLALLIP
jgi:hypothetical protein